MPELAEVSYFSKQWGAGIGLAVLAVQANAGSRVFRGCDVAAMRAGLRGARLRSSRTHGKQMLFGFSAGRWLGIHLGMTGELSAKPEPYAPVKHDQLTLRTKRVALVLHDPRQFGAVTFHEGKSPPPFWGALPPQSMDPAFSAQRVAEILLRHARQPLKALLLDQRYFPGIGNWMADEVLWRMKLPPHTAAGLLAPRQARELRRILRKVCDGALKTIGKDWRDPPKSWLFTHRWTRGNNCPRCGAKLRHETLLGRTACWCPVCQKSSAAER